MGATLWKVHTYMRTLRPNNVHHMCVCECMHARVQVVLKSDINVYFMYLVIISVHCMLPL